MDVRKYEAFLRAVECGNLTKAGEELGYTQSGISHMMKGFEAELGFKLVYRGNRGVVPTPDGEKLLPAIRELVKWHSAIEETVSSIKGLNTGTIRIGTLASISFSWLPRIIHSFQWDFPNVNIEIKEGGIKEIESWIADDSIDIGFLSIQKHSDYQTITLKSDRFLAILPLGHPMAHEEVFPLEKFNDQPFIISAKGSDYDIHRILAEHKVRPMTKFTSTDDHTIISMVEMGLGVSILPELMLAGRRDKVAALRLSPDCSRTLGIAFHSLRDISPATSKFKHYVTTLTFQE